MALINIIFRRNNMGIDLFGLNLNCNKNESSQSNESEINTNRPTGRKELIWSRPADKNNGISLHFHVNNLDAFTDNTDNNIEPLDEVLWINRKNMLFDAINQCINNNISKYCFKPHTVEIIFHRDDPENTENNISPNNTTIDKNDTIRISEPTCKFDDIYIPEKTKDTIKRSLLISRHRKELFENWKLGSGHQGRAIVFNFYGPSGTGKSLTGEAIAGELGKKVYLVNYSELESKYVGETPKNISNVFKKAQEDDAVLIFDEADSFLGKRLTNVTQSADYGVNITRSVMLMELEKFDGIVIFTTNLISNYDDAFKRRILASIPFELPDYSGRKNIWKIFLSRGIPLSNDITASFLAKAYENISGADIKDITLYAAVSALSRDENNILLTKHDFDDAYKLILNRRNSTNKAISIKTERVSTKEFEGAQYGDAR